MKRLLIVLMLLVVVGGAEAAPPTPPPPGAVSLVRIIEDGGRRQAVLRWEQQSSAGLVVVTGPHNLTLAAVRDAGPGQHEVSIDMIWWGWMPGAPVTLTEVWAGDRRPYERRPVWPFEVALPLLVRGQP